MLDLNQRFGHSPRITIKFTPALPCISCGAEATTGIAEFFPAKNIENPVPGIAFYMLQPLCAREIEAMARMYGILPDNS